MAGRDFDRARWLRRARNATIVAAVGAAIVLGVVGVVGFFVAPGLVQSLAERQIAEQLGRKATLGKVRLNPYRLSATIDDFKLYEADGTSIAVEVGTLFANVSSTSLLKRALVLDELRVTSPTIHVTRLAPQRFNFSDIVDKLASKPKSDTPFLFSLNNIQVDGGTVDVDDRVTGRKHVVDGIRVALPFISNLPYDTTIFVTPEFAARIDGSAIGLTGKAQPFSVTRETSMTLDVADLDLTEYVDLSPTPLPFALASGKLAAKLDLTFRATGKDADGKSVPQSASLSGHVGLASLDIKDRAGRSAVTVKALDVEIAKLDPFNGDVVLQRVEVTAPQVDATRRADGGIDLVDLFRMPSAPATTAPPAPRPATPAPTITIGSLKVVDGGLRFVDQLPKTPTTTSLKNVTFEASGFSSKGAAPATFKGSARADEAAVDVEGRVVVERRDIDGSFALKGFRPARVAPYLASTLAARIDDGSVDLAAHFHVEAAGAAPTGIVDRIVLRVDQLRTSLVDEKAVLVGAAQVALDGGRFDLATRAFTADSLRLVSPVISAKRDAKGRLNLLAAVVAVRPVATASTAAATPAPAVAVEVKPANAPAFTATVEALSIENGDFRFEDLSTPTPVRIRAQPLDFKAEHVGTATDTVVPFELTTGVDQRGKLAVRGKLRAVPLDLDATVDATQVPVAWLAAYAGERLNVVIDGADLNARGALRVAPASGAGKVATSIVTYRGALGVSRMRALDRTTSEEFVRWKTLDVPKVDFAMPGAAGAPLSLTLGDVALDDFYARVIVNASGRLNLQDVVAVPGQRQSVTTPDAPATPARPATPVVAPSSDPPAAIRVGAVQLTHGRIGITDNFIKPNYSADLTGLEGTVTALASNDAKPAGLKLTGRINGDGALDVSGSIDPFAPLKYTDIAAEAKDIELTRLTPYAVKYAGYAIDRGKLSMTVRYHIENGKLDASNRLFLDQLTFGAKVESPTATKLPVLLAIALLKNSRGEIDVNLPISGSLSDPQFSIGGVIGRVLVNLLTRAVTSPFSLIASAVGGLGAGADELGYVQFKPGSSDMTPQGKAKVETLAKALAERPALKLDIIGRFDPATDPEGIKRDHLLDRLKDLKAKDLSKGGDRIGRDAVTIEPAEYAALLARVYDDTKLPNKPRNVIGLAKTLPVEEMERLLLANIKLDADDPRWLAEARADVVRHYIEDTGRVAASRVFLVTPKLDANGIVDGAAASRVDFALR